MKTNNPDSADGITTEEPDKRTGSGAGLRAVDIAALAQTSALPRFALQVVGSALSPRFLAGDVVIIDTQALPAAGDAILVQTGGIVGPLGIMLLNADGDACDNDGGFEARGEYRTLGVVLTPEEAGCLAID